MNLKNLEINGALVQAIEAFDDTLGVVSARFVFRASGTCAEKKPGLARVCARIFDEGTKSLGVSEFAKILEIKAINLSINAGYESFSFGIDCLKEHFEFALEKFTQLLMEPNLCEDVLQKVVAMTLGEIAANQSEFDYLAKARLNKIMFEGSNLAYDGIGDKDSLLGITLKDVKEFIDTNLVLQNLYVVIGGEVKFDELRLKECLGVLKNSKQNELKHVDIVKEPKFEEFYKDTKQAYIYFGAPYNVEKEERYKASIATFVFGSSGFGSRLLEEIRVKRGLAYSAYAKNDFSLTHERIWGYLQTQNENCDEAVSVIKDEFARFVDGGITQSELDGAKKFILGSQPLLKETFFKRLNIAQDEFYAGFEFGEFERNLIKVAAISLDEMNSFIKSHREILKLSFAILRNER